MVLHVCLYITNKYDCYFKDFVGTDSWLLHHEVIAFGKSRGFVLRMPRRIIDVDWNRHHLGVDGMMFF